MKDLSGYSVVRSLAVGKHGSREIIQKALGILWARNGDGLDCGGWRERERSRWTEIFLNLLLNQMLGLKERSKDELQAPGLRDRGRGECQLTEMGARVLGADRLGE